MKNDNVVDLNNESWMGDILKHKAENYGKACEIIIMRQGELTRPYCKKCKKTLM